MAGEQGGLGSTKRWSVLTWERETQRERERERESAVEGDGERVRREREREMHPFSHVFDRGVFPTGVKKGRADWAE